MKTIFRISKGDTIKATLYGDDSKLLATLYDSGFTTIGQVKNTLSNKLNDYSKNQKSCTYLIINEDKDSYWSNR